MQTHVRLGEFFPENPRILADAKELIAYQQNAKTTLSTLESQSKTNQM